MILPCRIHRTRRLIDSVPLALLFAAFLLAPRNEAIGQGATVPLDITAGVDIGYDDHVIGSSATTSSSGQTSFFARENVVLSYDRPKERTELRLVAVGRFDQFLDVGTDDKDLNVTLSLTHNFSTRLSLRADVYAAYQTEPNFQSNVGPENVRAPHFDTRDTFSLTYHWLPRFNTVTSYTIDRVLYAQSSSVATSSNRTQQTLGEQFRFSLTSRTNLIGEYRFEIVDYDTSPRDSMTHFALAGIDHHLTEHLIIHALGGESFRSFKNDGDAVDPSFEGSLAYTSSNGSLKWTTSYGVEEPSAAGATTALIRTTIRTGLSLTYRLTDRINSTAAVYYHHDENGGSTSSPTSVGSQNSFDLTLGLRYTINKRFALHVDYNHSSVGSLGSTPGYSRNRYFAGLTYTY
jgi:hypothetical protein